MTHFICKACGSDAWIGHKRPWRKVTYKGQTNLRQLCEMCGNYALAFAKKHE